MRIAAIITLFVFYSAQSQQVEVYFDFNKYTLTDQAVKVLEDAIRNNQVQVSKIYGYCDWKGSNAYNDTLSARRVDEVFHFLRRKGVKIMDDYEGRGYGEDFEQLPDQALNRKVQVIFEPVPPPKLPVDELNRLFREAKAGEKIKLQNIHFQNNSAVVVAKSKSVLYDLLCVMEENPDLKIQIQGHICCQTFGDPGDISTARARAVFNFLIRNKINRKRLSFKGFGTSQPIHPIPEKSDAEENDNRRVEILVIAN
jgi:outer membrane protein OmpA-like peptidoglycan-associated protein